MVGYNFLFRSGHWLRGVCVCSDNYRLPDLDLLASGGEITFWPYNPGVKRMHTRASEVREEIRTRVNA